MRRSGLAIAACLLALAAVLHVSGVLGAGAGGASDEATERASVADPEVDPILRPAPPPRSGTERRVAPSRPVASAEPAALTRVEGRVLDEGGRPLAGATVRALGATTGTTEALTDESGLFVLELPPPGTFPLSVSAPERAEVTLTAAARLAIVLGKNPMLRGQVLDEASQAPVAGVLITARPAAAPGAAQGPRTHTDPSGRFALTLPAAGPYTVEVAGAGYAGQPGSEEYLPRVLKDVDAGRGDLRILMARGLAIEGSVVNDGGEPLRGPLVAEALGRLPNGDPDFTRRRRVIRRDGTLRVPGLAPGRYDLSVRPASGPESEAGPNVAATVVLDVEAGTTGLLVRLARGGTLVGRLEDDTRELVLEKGWVLAMRQGETRRELAVWAELVGDGSFRLRDLEAGVRYDLEAGGFGTLRPGSTRGVTPGDAGVVITLPRGARIAGRVIDARGMPAPPGVTVGACAMEGSPDLPGRRVFTSTGEDGRFVLGGLAELRFEVQAGGGLTGYLGEQVSDVKPGAEDLVLRVDPGVRLTGMLVDAQGQPVATTSLGANDGAHRASMHPYAQVGPDGKFTLSGLKPGPVTLYTMRGGACVMLGQVEAPATDLKVLVPAE